MARGKNPNSLANLSKGRTKGRGKNNDNATGGDANTFKALIEAVSGTDLSDKLWALLKEQYGIDKAWCRAKGITQYRKLAKVVQMFSDDSPAMAKELMERSEGKITQPNTNLNLDLSSLTMEQLERISKGEDVSTVLATSGQSGD